LLKSKHVLDDDEIKRIRARIRSQYAGERKWHEIMILDAEAEYQRMGLNLDEMAFPALRGLTESRICAVFDVPPILVGVQVGLDRSTFSNYAESRKALWFDKLIPDNQRIAEAFTLGFANDLGEDGIVAHDYSGVRILQEERNAQFARATQGWTSGLIMKNEGRREVGLPPVEGGDVFIPNPKVLAEPAKA
jgi:HK97 family phage portal protein